MALCAEDGRLQKVKDQLGDWRRWGTYLPERQWGTVRESDPEHGKPWEDFTYEMARYRAYRWGEDGLMGWTDNECRLCYSTSLWNGRDNCLKERLFGLSNAEGNHGEDVKEQFYYLDATPTHSYAKALYKYPSVLSRMIACAKRTAGELYKTESLSCRIRAHLKTIDTLM